MQLMLLIFISLLIYIICDYQLFAPFRADYGKGYYGYKDTDGKIRILPKYDYADSFSNGLARVGFWGKYGFINKRGKEVIPLDYDWVWNFEEGLAVVTLNGKWGFINKTGEEVIPLDYDNADSFRFNGLARVELNLKRGFIDKTGKEYWDMTEDEARQQMKNARSKLTNLIHTLFPD